MSEKRLILVTPKGYLAIYDLSLKPGKTEDQLVQHTLEEQAIQGHYKKGTSFYLVNETDIPLKTDEEQYFREALEYSHASDAFSFPIEKAKVAHLKKLDQLRKKKLKVLRDREDRGENMAAQIVAMQASLNGFKMDGALDLASLRQMMPDELKD